MYKNFGDPFQHSSRLGSVTLAQLATIQVAESEVDTYFTACEEYRLSGVTLPFWHDWSLSEPSRFLTPEPLHHWHCMWYDHDLKWCLRTVGSQELDFRFAILQPVVGQQHFKTGKYIIALVAGANGPSPAFIRAIHALMDFRYLSQAPVLTDTICQKISEALQEFHDNKHAIISLGGRCGKKNNALDNWYIPKLELMQSVVPSVSNVGSILQWSADTTEHAHITLIKDPGEATNNHNHDPQICRFLDRAEKCCLFDDAVCLSLAASEASRIKDNVDGNGDRDGNGDGDSDNNNNNNNNGYVEIPEIHPASAHKLVQHGSMAVRPLRTLICGSVAIHLNYDPSI
ncbi:hypothetical protein PAXINDRAFT_21746 [Paxillus involutus ATCC 200175]|uniref:Unplaced genomic scaffold PAXINscaffold_2036, whole genome shotgun sequence n=1 Tax=Paxillus involutus ATCC 200175 TaxID=664439 RepID=A0A0C9SLT3_PAXIN|nr:hypothetical protein PAXINDRAFT_21746 [Paxillus involutus ATCC 200175]